jgi:Flp pilus assembly protein TadB
VSESESEHNERQLSELLQETRVVMPGVQVLFAFLLSVPFQQQFHQTTAFQKDVYLVTVLLAAAATICFIAPAAYHRVQFEQHDKPHLIRTGNRFLIAGMGFLSLAMCAAVMLVCDVIFKTPTVAVVVAVLALAFAWTWFGYPLTRRLRGERSSR